MKVHAIKILLLLLMLSIIFQACSTKKNYLPDNFSNLVLKKKLTGAAAKSFVNNIHLENVAARENEVGFYEDILGIAIIYVSHYSEVNLAISQYKKMIDRLIPDDSLFNEGTFVKVENKEVYKCFGGGQTHFIFTHETSLFWVSVNRHAGDEFIKNYITYID